MCCGSPSHVCHAVQCLCVSVDDEERDDSAGAVGGGYERVLQSAELSPGQGRDPVHQGGPAHGWVRHGVLHSQGQSSA